jgi:penicillin-binding protein 1A
MSIVIDRGTAAPARYNYDLKGALAGKNGTTQFQSDGIFVGMSPKLLQEHGSDVLIEELVSIVSGMARVEKTALPIWGEFVKKTSK